MKLTNTGWWLNIHNAQAQFTKDQNVLVEEVFTYATKK